MGNIKGFMNIGFVILCLGLLWYLFTTDSTQTGNLQTNIPKTTNPYPKEKTRPNRKYPDDLSFNPQNGSNLTPAGPSQAYSGKILGGKRRFSRDGKLGTYTGPLRGDNPHGFAVFEYDNGDMYVGEYQNGARSGYGNSIFKKRGQVQLRRYSNGEMKMKENIRGAKYGSLAFIHAGTKGTYLGPMRERQPHGFGYFKYSNGDMYVGSYQNGVRNGAGNLIFTNGDVLFLEYDNGRELTRSSKF